MVLALLFVLSLFSVSSESEILELMNIHRDTIAGVVESFRVKANTTAFTMLEGQKDLYKCTFGKTLLVDLDEDGRVGKGGVGMPPAETKAKKRAEAAAAGDRTAQEEVVEGGVPERLRPRAGLPRPSPRPSERSDRKAELAVPRRRARTARVVLVGSLEEA